MIFMSSVFVFFMIQQSPSITLPDTLFPYTTLFRSRLHRLRAIEDAAPFIVCDPVDRQPLILRAARDHHRAAAQPPAVGEAQAIGVGVAFEDRKSTRLNSSH